MEYRDGLLRQYRASEKHRLVIENRVRVAVGRRLPPPPLRPMLALLTHTGSYIGYGEFDAKELTGHPAVHVSYRFDGFLDDTYSTLVVRLHHTDRSNSKKLWGYAAILEPILENSWGSSRHATAKALEKTKCISIPRSPSKKDHICEICPRARPPDRRLYCHWAVWHG